MILDQLSLKILRILFTVGNVDWDIGRHSGRYSVYSNKCCWTKSYIGWDTSGTTINCVSTECRLTIDRLSTAISTECQLSIDPVSTKYRPSVDRLSTECRPTIDWVSTAISTDISVDITHSKQDPILLIALKSVSPVIVRILSL